MTKEDFLKELEYMLQDLAEEEREEALQYYRDYLEDAGPEEEGAVLQELGSPARVAAMIKAGLDGSEQGEFSESGYGDPRYDGPVYPVEERKQRADRRFDRTFRKERSGNRSSAYEPEREAGQEGKVRRDTAPWVVVLVIILCLMAAPAILGIGGGILGVLLGAAGVLLGLFVAVGAMTVGFFIGGAVAFLVGIFQFFHSPIHGVLACFAGIALIGLGLLVLAFAIWFYGKALPALVRAACHGIHTLFQGRSRGGKTAI
ncbi:DUF1700 domain-containing protein [Hominifimenecus sp. rT4P-3]|uniref:DUF1700 domain-containing protein n=1 Tax=Hominifimenecus sp. rT4P-3 TaxID=3242979 RepID=UPI003DA30B34